MRKFFREFLDWLGSEPVRAMNRWSSHVITRSSCNKPVEKLKNVEVCGDTIAWLRRG